ncbi:hypothetical protein N0V90_003955 [Kalmusia sp. IMI 367209]|nr:hypothetical protein N0V90_003955 [Kalmusia sp. IMI 367209]
MAPTYLTTLSAFTQFLTVYTHSLLYLRALYPRTSFLRARFYNTPIYQSRVPSVCTWILDAVTAVHDELAKGTVARIAIVVFHASSKDDKSQGTGSVQVLERFLLDVKWAKTEEERQQAAEKAAADREEAKDDDEGERPEDLGAEADPNLAEQFRAALITLTTRVSRLAPLPAGCSFNISMELKDEADIHPPMEHPQRWVPVQPSLQKTGRKGAEGVEHGSETKGRSEGEDLGGAKVTPIRTVEVGVFRFETWIEEGKAKFETKTPSQAPSKDSPESSKG